MKKKSNVKRPTVGQISRDLTIKNEQIDHTPTEQMHEQLTDYDKNMAECIAKHLKIYPKDFYVVVLTKKERLMQNVLRSMFFARRTCPTPEYDQAVYFYNRELDTPQLLWVVPAKDVCSYLIMEALNLPSDQRELLNYVLDFLEGRLLQKAKELNGEEYTSPLLAKG